MATDKGTVTPPAGFTLDNDNSQANVTPPPGFKLDGDNTPPSQSKPAPEEDTNPVHEGFFKSLGHNLGIPTSGDELKSTLKSFLPQDAEEAGNFGVNPVAPLIEHMVKGYASHTSHAISEGNKEEDDALDNVQKGQPLLPNLGKIAYSKVKTAGALLAPAGGEIATQLGDKAGDNPTELKHPIDFLYNKNGNYRGAAGNATAAGIQTILGKIFGLKGDLAEGAAAGDAASGAEKIAGAELPVTTGQKTGNPGAQMTEKFLKGTFVGGPLKKVEAAQQSGVRQGLANLAGSPATPENIEGNWFDAAAKTRAKASPMYDRISWDTTAKATPFEESSAVVQDLASNDDLQRIPGVKKALAGITENEPGPNITIANQVAKDFGYKGNYLDLDPAAKANVDKLLPPDVKTGIQAETNPVNFSKLQQLRSDLADIAASSKDRAAQYQARKALDNLDGAIDKDLSTHDAANGTALKDLRASANGLWARNYAQREFGESLQSMLKNQSRQTTRNINAHGLNEAINALEDSGQAKYLFGSAKAQNLAELKKLGDFLQKVQPGSQGMTGALGKLAMVYGLLKMPFEIATGGTGAAATTAGMMGSAAITAKVLATPGGAAAIHAFLKASPHSPAAGFLASNLQKMAQQADQPAPSPQTHVFDPQQWKAANPKGDVNAAIESATKQGYKIK